MKISMIRKLTFAAVTMVLSGCMTVPERFAAQRPPTAAEKQSIVDGARNVLRDPYSIRDVEISNYIPVDEHSGHICVLANAKNGYGAYTGRTGTLVAMQNGKAVNAWEGHPMCGMAQMQYRPFPEIYRLRNM